MSAGRVSMRQVGGSAKSSVHMRNAGCRIVARLEVAREKAMNRACTKCCSVAMRQKLSQAVEVSAGSGAKAVARSGYSAR